VSHRKQRARSNRQSDRYGAVAGNAYNENARDFVASGRVEPAARDAERAVEGREAEALHEAEEAGKARLHLSKTDMAIAFWHRLERAARAALHELRH
jgi:hypothetical protein